VVADLPAARVDAHTALALAAVAAAVWLVVRQGRRRLSSQHRVVACALVAGAALVATAWVATASAPVWNPPAGFRVTFLDVGQGDSVLLETRQARILVDEGPPEADVAGQLIRMGIHSLSAIVLTHPQRDHVGGAAEVVRKLAVAQVLEPGLQVTGPESEEALAAARERGASIRVVRTGTSFRVGRLRLNVLWPADAGAPGEDPNFNAVVLVASYLATDVFLSADAESDVTAKLPLPPVEIMKVAHHGSEDPGLADELTTLRPRIAVISCGRNNDYGHPRPETLAALAGEAGLAVYRTDLNGRVVVESDGHRLTVRTQR
jgi:competence protein ComEC